jgi:SAM-dependent methyltransferase
MRATTMARAGLRAAVLSVLRLLNGLAGAVPVRAALPPEAIAPRRPLREPREARYKATLTTGSRMRFHCAVCGRTSLVTWGSGALRESVLCLRCGSYNRQRQVAVVVLRRHAPARSLRELAARRRELRILNTEANGALHRAFAGLPWYVASEYLGPEHTSGDVVDGILHQDLMRTSFPDQAFDLVISSDVFEHIADPYAALRELFRILAPGGRHVMTAPFDSEAWHDLVRARVEEDGSITHLLAPEYHGDRTRPDEGILCFRRFGLELLDKSEEIGFEAISHRVQAPRLGVGGRGAFVFELVRPSAE